MVFAFSGPSLAIEFFFFFFAAAMKGGKPPEDPYHMKLLEATTVALDGGPAQPAIYGGLIVALCRVTLTSPSQYGRRWQVANTSTAPDKSLLNLQFVSSFTFDLRNWDCGSDAVKYTPAEVF